MMADGFIVNCTQKGTMRIAIPDQEKDTQLVTPLLDTLLVEGLQAHLIFIPALNKSGITAQFDTDCAWLTINGRDIMTPNPYHRQTNKYEVPFVTRTNQQEMAPDKIPAISPEAEQPLNIQISLEVMHRQMGHQSFKNIVAAEASKAWKGVSIRQAPDDYCVECKIGGIVKTKRGHNPRSLATYYS
jgi:hypothetical protein